MAKGNCVERGQGDLFCKSEGEEIGILHYDSHSDRFSVQGTEIRTVLPAHEVLDAISNDFCAGTHAESFNGVAIRSLELHLYAASGRTGEVEEEGLAGEGEWFGHKLPPRIGSTHGDEAIGPNRVAAQVDGLVAR